MIILLSQINCYSGNGYLFMENRLCPATQKDGSLEIRSSLREYVKKLFADIQAKEQSFWSNELR
ncbi:hypothetical protein V6Z11_A05G112700 [Gossypium hirsutum]